MFILTAQTPAHADAVETLLDSAFGPGRTAKSSYRFRDGVAPLPGLGFVAVRHGALVGTLRFWPVTVGAEAVPAVLLGPLAVAPGHQGEGIGAGLIGTGLSAAAAAGHKLVVLVGDAAYYRRFGFRPSVETGILIPGENPARTLAWRAADWGMGGAVAKAA